MTHFSLILILATSLQIGAPPKPVEKKEASRCHVYIDYKYIWTLEMVENFNEPAVPILNIITFVDDEQPLRPEQIQIYNDRGQRAEIEKFSIDTGMDPYITNYLKVLSHSFFGMDLTGDFSQFSEPTRVAVELGETEFTLQPIDCMDFDMLAEQIARINVNSPDVREDFSVLKIPHLGSSGPRRQGRR